MKKHPAIIFNCHYNGLSIIQELGRRGIEVLALDSNRSIGTYSKYAKYYRCPDPLVEEKSFINYLIEIGSHFKEKAIIFPTNDHWAMAISRNQDILSNYYILSVPDYSIMQLIIEKQRFYEWSATRGYPVPQSWSIDNISLIPDDIYPIISKPEYRRIPSNDPKLKNLSNILDNMRFTVLNDKEELYSFIINNKDIVQYFIFQEYVKGLSDRMFTIGVYVNKDHDVLGMFTGRKVRGYPPDIGDCILGQVESVPSEIKELTKVICKEIKYHGIAEFEFKKDLITNEFKLIEINPRSWSWVGITPFTGVSLPWIAYQDLATNRMQAYVESNLPDGSIKYVKIIPDFVNCMFKNKKAGYHQWDMSFHQWWCSLKATKVVYAEFSKDDFMPGIFSIIKHIKDGIRSIFKP